MQKIDKPAQPGIMIVKLVVARRHGIKTDSVHQRRIGLTTKQGVVEIACGGIARVQLEQIALPAESCFISAVTRGKPPIATSTRWFPAATAPDSPAGGSDDR